MRMFATICVDSLTMFVGTIFKAQRAAIQYDLEVLLRRQCRAEKHGTAAINVTELSRISKDEIMKIES